MCFLKKSRNLGHEHWELVIFAAALYREMYEKKITWQQTWSSVFGLFQDLRNYQYSLSMVEGLRIHMEMGHSYIDIPKGSFNEVTLQ